MIQSNGQFQMLPVESLVLDQANPRVARYIEMYGGNVNEDQMELALGANSYETGENNTTFYSLRAAIQTHGGLIHPILVNKDRGESLVVIEGNTRALIYRQFKSNGLDGDWDEIPSIVYENLGKTTIDAIRLQAHLVGPREWDPYSKAKYLDYLRNSKHLTIEQIIDFCGGRGAEVHRFIDAYNDMERYYRDVLDSDGEFDPTRFSSFAEMQNPRIREGLFAAGYTKSDFAQWVKDGKLVPQNLIRRLPAILGDPEAHRVFIKDGAREAEKIINAPSTKEALRDATMVQIALEITRRIIEMTYGDLNRLREDLNTPENQALTEARDQLIGLCKDIAAS